MSEGSWRAFSEPLGSRLAEDNYLLCVGAGGCCEFVKWSCAGHRLYIVAPSNTLERVSTCVSTELFVGRGVYMNLT
jgi:hypothetical protein